MWHIEAGVDMNKSSFFSLGRASVTLSSLAIWLIIGSTPALQLASLFYVYVCGTCPRGAGLILGLLLWVNEREPKRRKSIFVILAAGSVWLIAPNCVCINTGTVHKLTIPTRVIGSSKIRSFFTLRHVGHCPSCYFGYRNVTFEKVVLVSPIRGRQMYIQLGPIDRVILYTSWNKLVLSNRSNEIPSFLRGAFKF